MAFRISPKGKIKESPLPKINRKTFMKMESRVIVDNPLLMGIKAKRVLIKEIQLELELFSYSSNTLLTNAAFLKGNPIEFYSQDANRNYVEKTLFGEIVKQANKRNTKLYKIKDTTNSLTDNVCFFAISVGHIEANKQTNIPSVVIDYFIVNDKYRKQTLNNGLTIAQECFRSILSLIDQLSNQIGIRYIILQPLNKEAKIIKFYDDFGFKFIQGRKSDWMYLDIAYIK